MSFVPLFICALSNGIVFSQIVGGSEQVEFGIDWQEILVEHQQVEAIPVQEFEMIFHSFDETWSSWLVGRVISAVV